MRHLVDAVDVDADREAAHDDAAAERRDLAVRPDLAVRLLDDVALEVGDVLRGLEADHIVSEQRLDQPGVLGHRGQHVGRREWNVQEEADRAADPLAAQFGAHRDQVIIVHPNDVLAADQLGKIRRHLGVDPAVAVEEGRFIVQEAEPIVQRGPQHPVGVAEVIALVVAAR